MRSGGSGDIQRGGSTSLTSFLDRMGGRSCPLGPKISRHPLGLVICPIFSGEAPMGPVTTRLWRKMKLNTKLESYRLLSNDGLGSQRERTFAKKNKVAMRARTSLSDPTLPPTLLRCPLASTPPPCPSERRRRHSQHHGQPPHFVALLSPQQGRSPPSPPSPFLYLVA